MHKNNLKLLQRSMFDSKFKAIEKQSDINLSPNSRKERKLFDMKNKKLNSVET